MTLEAKITFKHVKVRTSPDNKPDPFKRTPVSFFAHLEFVPTCFKIEKMIK